MWSRAELGTQRVFGKYSLWLSGVKEDPEAEVAWNEGGVRGAHNQELPKCEKQLYLYFPLSRYFQKLAFHFQALKTQTSL